ncbi:hypothetical protein CDCA_CDCA07G2014 [Cyanidium caldarium]|uniref:Transmembrane 9 superfamily member n=1 Tax=Cyanidium caldarium TaxID=2771 RepID=A0AAV9IUQ3_CYACA|nr:hypothetical protein CDCA_CDCA07G2014 [Cyanidium caldarium]
MHAAHHLVTLLLLLSTLIASSDHSAQAFYVPGVAPVDYERGAPLTIKTTKLVSRRSVLPFSYYSLPFCRPERVRKYSENLGELLSGARVYSTPYRLAMLEDARCQVLCRRVLEKRGAYMLGQRVKQEFRALLQLDNLPVGQPIYAEGEKVGIERGYPLGYADASGRLCLNNHLSFTVLYHQPRNRFTGSRNGYRIVGFEVETASVKHRAAPGSEGAAPAAMQLSTCSRDQGLEHVPQCQGIGTGEEVIFTYDVKYQESPVAWASRWDIYLQQPGPAASVHWFSIINSSLIVVFLAATVGMILLRTVHQDFARYNNLGGGDDDGDEEEEYGWKLLHGDVFRAPANLGFFSVLIGSGVQILAMTLIVLVFAAAGFLSPANRGGLLTAMVFLWIFMSALSGYASARLYKSFRGTTPKRVTLMTAVFFPGIVFGIFFMLNLVLWASQSSAALPFFSLLFWTVLWFGISVPLSFFGSYLGYRRREVEFPCRTNVIPRQVPPLPFYARTSVAVAFGGLLPFGSVFLSLFFILSSVMLNQYYYFFGFLALSVLILLVTTALNSMIFVYVRLAAEDWRWIWYSFMVSASAGAYMFLYSIIYLLQRTELDDMTAVSGLLYVAYCSMAAAAFSLAVGATGFLSAFVFVLRMFSVVKVD